MAKRNPVVKKLPDELKFWKPSPKKSGEGSPVSSGKKMSARQPGGTADKIEAPVFWERKFPLPTDTIWSGNADRVPAGYTPDRKWNCPSCDVAPGARHEQWCPRFLYQLNPYNASAYDSELFLADYIDTQIFFGEGHPEKSSHVPNGELILSRAGITRSNNGEG